MKTNTSKLLLSLACLTLMIGSKAAAQTNVSGGIYANTVWTKANSPYIVTDTVVVFGGITLTIQPGVVVKFNDSALIEIDIKGNLFANGTANDSIIFTSNSLKPYAGIYQGINTNLDTSSFRYCRFSYAYNAVNVFSAVRYNPRIAHCLFNSDIIGLNNWYSWSIDTCIFIYDSTALFDPGPGVAFGCDFIKNGYGINYNDQTSFFYCTFINNNYGINSSGMDTIAYCIFDSNRAYGIFGGGDNIRNCSFKYNHFGIRSDADVITLNDISDNYIGIETFDNDKISCNTICNNTHYNIVADYSVNESVKDNYWCLPDSAHIQATIYDAYQDISLGFDYFTPFDTAACANVYTKVNELPASSGGINVYPNPGSGVFTIQGLVVSGQWSVEVYNVIGEKVKTQCIASLQPSAPSSGRDVPSTRDVFAMDLRSNPSGIYFYRVVQEDGTQIGMGK